jgi:hypothetical protein
VAIVHSTWFERRFNDDVFDFREVVVDIFDVVSDIFTDILDVFTDVFGCVFDIERDCDFIGVFDSDFIGVFVSDFIGVFDSDLIGIFLLDVIGVFVRDFVGIFVSDFIRVFVRDFVDVFVFVVLNTSRTFDIDRPGSFFIVIVFDSVCVGCEDEDLKDDEGVRVLNFKSDRKPTGDDFDAGGRTSYVGRLRCDDIRSLFVTLIDTGLSSGI